jgi:hypothetical protein
VLRALPLLLLATAAASGEARADETFARLKNRPTYLTPQSLGTAGQPVPGFWWWRSGSSGEQSLLQLTVLANGEWLVLHRRAGPQVDRSIRADSRHLLGDDPPGGVVGQFKGNGKCYAGLIQTVELRRPGRPPQCPDFYWWTRTQMCFDEQRGKASAKTAGFMHDAATCEVDRSRPSSLDATLERFSGAAFAPVAGAAYIRTLTVVAPAQFAAEVRLAWDYRIFQAEGRMPARVVLSERGSAAPQVFATPRLSGVHRHPVTGRRSHLVMQLLDRNGRELHQDHLVADLR